MTLNDALLALNNDAIAFDAGKCIRSVTVVVTMRAADGKVFLQPVDEAYAPVWLAALGPTQLLTLGAQGYSKLISRPMDLATITCKIQNGEYRTAWDYLVCAMHCASGTVSITIQPSSS